MSIESFPLPEQSSAEIKLIEDPEVTAADIFGDLPEVGGSKIILQRHERSTRKLSGKEGERLGSLTPESSESVYIHARRILREMFASVKEEERRGVYFLVVGSDTKFRGQGMRSLETANQVLRALKDELDEERMDQDRVLNNFSKTKHASPISRAREPQFLDDSPTFVAFLKQKYGEMTPEFWQAFEEDTHKGERQKFKAEGPDEMDKRFVGYVRALSKYAVYFHKNHPGARLVIWCVSHYDTVSPFLKRHITKTDPLQPVPIDYGAGISIEIDPQGAVSSRFRGKEYCVDFKN